MRVFERRKPLNVILALLLTLTASCSASRMSISAAKEDYLKASAPPVEGTKTRVAGAALGALAGAILGAALGAAGGGSSTAMATGVAVGTMVGTGAGVAYADSVVKERQEYANASAYLSACSNALDTQVKSAQAFNDVLGKELDNVAKRDDDLDAAIEDATEVDARIREQIDVQKAALETARGEDIDESTADAQRRRIEQLQAEETRLSAHIERLSTLRSRAVVENPGR